MIGNLVDFLNDRFLQKDGGIKHLLSFEIEEERERQGRLKEDVKTDAKQRLA